MEDSQRNVSASVDESPDQRWTLMFIGDKGQVLTIRRFKGVAVSVAVLVVILALVSASLFFFYRRPARENKLLRAQLTEAETTITQLNDEKDRLTARLVLIETQLSAAPPEAPPSPETTRAAVPEKPSAAPAVSAEPATPATAPAASPPEPPKMEMAASDLQTVRDDNDVLRIRYTLKNVNDAVKPARGRTFVILDPEDGTPSHYLSYPRTSLVNGKPESWRKGRYFSINRFNIIRFKTTETMDPKRYSEARVLVYNKAGEMILEKHFPVTIPEPKPAPPPPPESPAPPAVEAPAAPSPTVTTVEPSTDADSSTMAAPVPEQGPTPESPATAPVDVPEAGMPNPISEAARP